MTRINSNLRVWTPEVENGEWERQRCEEIAGEGVLEISDPDSTVENVRPCGKHTVNVCLMPREEVVDARKAVGPQVAHWLRKEAARLMAVADRIRRAHHAEYGGEVQGQETPAELVPRPSGGLDCVIVVESRGVFAV